MTYEELQSKVQHYYEKTEYCCSESVLKSLLEFYNIEHSDDDIVLAAPFGGGLGKYGCVCGTISGAVMAFAHIFKREKVPYTQQQIEEAEKNNKKLPEQTLVSSYLTKKLHDSFAQTHKKPCCRILTHPYKDDRKAKKQYCSSLNAETVLISVKLIDAYKSNSLL